MSDEPVELPVDPLVEGLVVCAIVAVGINAATAAAIIIVRTVSLLFNASQTQKHAEQCTINHNAGMFICVRKRTMRKVYCLFFERRFNENADDICLFRNLPVMSDPATLYMRSADFAEAKASSGKIYTGWFGACVQRLLQLKPGTFDEFWIESPAGRYNSFQICAAKDQDLLVRVPPLLNVIQDNLAIKPKP